MKNKNLGHSVLKYGQKVKLDPTRNVQVSTGLKRKFFKVVGFWYKQKLVKYDPTINNDSIRSFSGVAIKDKEGHIYSVNRYQLKAISKRK